MAHGYHDGSPGPSLAWAVVPRRQPWLSGCAIRSFGTLRMPKYSSRWSVAQMRSKSNRTIKKPVLITTGETRRIQQHELPGEGYTDETVEMLWMSEQRGKSQASFSSRKYCGRSTRQGGLGWRTCSVCSCSWNAYSRIDVDETNARLCPAQLVAIEK